MNKCIKRIKYIIYILYICHIIVIYAKNIGELDYYKKYMANNITDVINNNFFHSEYKKLFIMSINNFDIIKCILFFNIINV